MLIYTHMCVNVAGSFEKNNHFSMIFFICKCKISIVPNLFMAKIILIFQKIFVLMLFKMPTNQAECSNLFIRSELAKKCKPCKIYSRTCYVYGENILSKIFTDGRNVGLDKQIWLLKTIRRMETYWVQVRKKWSGS